MSIPADSAKDILLSAISSNSSIMPGSLKLIGIVKVNENFCIAAYRYAFVQKERDVVRRLGFVTGLQQGGLWQPYFGGGGERDDTGNTAFTCLFGTTNPLNGPTPHPFTCVVGRADPAVVAGITIVGHDPSSTDIYISPVSEYFIVCTSQTPTSLTISAHDADGNNVIEIQNLQMR
jgi:hypothetical protein